jgi:aspartyl-tRNA(Asn)/glutamyl-tRNA(Gln) amidotransferase subunit A
MEGLLNLDATELAQRIAAREVSAESVTALLIEHARATEPAVGAYLHIDEAGALEQARAVDAGTRRGALAGVPVAVKDNIHVSVLIGKTNLDEFAMGSSCENSALGVTRNPWDRARVPGGSSGGSAAAVAARGAFLSLGSDTGGSIRLPAGFCGVVGLKPSYGRVSRYGLVAFASSLDQIGPFARSVRDVALAMQIMAGRDEHDSTSSNRPVNEYAQSLRSDLKGLRVGVVRAYLDEMPNREVAGACQAALVRMQELGAEIVDVTLPHADHGIAVYYVVASAEASSNLARFDGVRYGPREEAESGIESYFRTRGKGFGPEVKRRIMLGTYALSAGHWEEFYGRAAKVRTLICRDFERAFEGCDLIAGPTAPFTAFKAGEKSDPLSMYLCDVFTIPASMAGLCALSLPVGFDAAGLPVGLQLQAPAFEEGRLLAAAGALEKTLRAEVDRAPAIA